MRNICLLEIKNNLYTLSATITFEKLFLFGNFSWFEYSNLSSPLGNLFCILALYSFPILNTKKPSEDINSDIVQLTLSLSKIHPLVFLVMWSIIHSQLLFLLMVLFDPDQSIFYFLVSGWFIFYFLISLLLTFLLVPR